MKLLSKEEVKKLNRALAYSVDKMSDEDKKEAILILRDRISDVVSNNKYHMELLAKFIYKVSKEYHESGHNSTST